MDTGQAIDVEVDCGPGAPCKLLHVMIDVSALEQRGQKPFLGGYRHKHSGALYHHACSQTPQAATQKGRQQAAAAAEQGLPAKQKLCRETQTIKAANTSCQTVREAATQMARPGLELDCSGDRLLTPRPYTTSEEVAARRAAAAVTIQRYSRGWMARLRADALRAIKDERDGFLAQAAAERTAAAQAERRHEVERRTHPLSHDDFELLSSELEAWRQQQTAAIKAAAAAAAEQQQQEQQGFDQQAALQLLLAKETRLLQTLDKLRVNARKETKALASQKLLGHLAQPKTWTLSNGKKVMVHTPTTVRAAELQQLHRGLTLPGLSLDERLDVLLHVKWAVKEHDCGLSRELVELIDREADLLNRGRSAKTLDGLRRRIAGLFLAFCKNPAFNPEAGQLQLVPGGPAEPETFEYVDDVDVAS
ncbi:hypothetical protein OEZ85_010297 [Tetradesmus obliquus]|uniref:IQ motif and ubiquitin-like domain-containing protein n=1 Tax=Tetradesmus obliquus TaxID=3088 RepID=A0ABY8TLZ6_TETOB|nr:hypothetical protein OEZ85_010297 [Tetradesmus obliquus]